MQVVLQIRPLQSGREPEGTEGRWDRDDLMLFFGGNSPAALTRYCGKQREMSEHMERWTGYNIKSAHFEEFILNKRPLTSP